MKRRTFLKYSTASLIGFPELVTSLNASEYKNISKYFPTTFLNNPLNLEKENDVNKIIKKVEIDEKIKNKNMFIEDKYINEFASVRNKLKLVQRYVGYGNFNIISFDEMIRMALKSKDIEVFTKSELEFMESMFYYDPSIHGFYGQRITQNITDTINKKETIKIPHTGHYLFRGEPEKIYNKMCDDIGNSLILTSGIRSVVKQTKLFLDKVASVDNNLNIASKSLAPPAYTYHAIADFDVGKKGFGFANFTSRFALTQEFIKMRKLKYIDMRYTINNKDGVRYEPWHVKVI